MARVGALMLGGVLNLREKISDHFLLRGARPDPERSHRFRAPKMAETDPGRPVRRGRQATTGWKVRGYENGRTGWSARRHGDKRQPYTAWWPMVDTNVMTDWRARKRLCRALDGGQCPSRPANLSLFLLIVLIRHASGLRLGEACRPERKIKRKRKENDDWARDRL